jgi:hypothetical protein
MEKIGWIVRWGGQLRGVASSVVKYVSSYSTIKVIYKYYRTIFKYLNFAYKIRDRKR